MTYSPQFFQPEGPLSSLAGYEHRNLQQEMADTIYSCLQDGHIGLIEAGTGTGKSLAYLYPALCYAKAHGEKIVISTNTINLQEQLLNKDLPVLHKLELDYKAVVVKGWANYPCWLRVDELVTAENSEYDQQVLISILKDLEQNTLVNLPEHEFLSVELREEIQAESDMCMRGRCQFFNQCPVFKARSLAEQADILIVNHHLLLADVNVRRDTGWEDSAVLPVYQHVIFDEAHHISDIATEYFSVSFSLLRVRRFLGLLHRTRSKTGIGLFSYIRTRLSQMDCEQAQVIIHMIDWELLPQLRAVDEAALAFVTSLEEFLRANVPNQESLRIKSAIMLESDSILEPYDRIHTGLGILLAQLCKFVTLCEELDAEHELGLSINLQSYCERTQNLLIDLDFLMDIADGDYVYWLKLPTRGQGAVLQAAPINVGTALKEHLFYRVETAIFTSATLSVNNDFCYFRNQVGLAHEFWDVEERIYNSPFELSTQTYLGILRDLPEPNASQFVTEFIEQLEHLLALTQGRAFILFTSYQMLNQVIAGVRQKGLDQNYTFLVQGEMARSNMLEHFVHQENAVLLGTDSFWEGVDIAGAALSSVIITKLPFKVPTDPLLVARSEQLQAEGRNPFTEMFLPQAVLKFRQGCGRLIRTGEDRGLIIVCDRRIMERNYGSAFLSSLPGAQINYKTIVEIEKEVKQWL